MMVNNSSAQKRINKNHRTHTKYNPTFLQSALIFVGVLLCLVTINSVWAATPKDVLIVGQVAEPKSLDPQAVTAVNDFRIVINLYDGLVRYKDDSLEVEPDLATSWKITDAGKSGSTSNESSL